MAEATTSLEFIKLLIRIFEKDGFVLKEFIQSLDCNLSGSDINKKRIPAEIFFLIWEKIESENLDRNLGLHLGERALDFPGQFLFSIMHNSSNLTEGIYKFCKYHNIMNDIFNPEFNIHHKIAILSLKSSVSKENQYRHIIEALLSMYFLLLKKLSENRVKFKEIHFTHPQPKDISEHKRIFSIPLLFNQEENKILFYKKNLNQPILFANPELLDMLENYAKTLQQKYFSSPEWSGKVLQVLLTRFPGTRPDIKSVAQTLAISTRSMQIKLKKEGITFNTLLNKIRKELAIKYLENTDLSIFEVACLLGYSDQSTFNRSFKQWTGSSPKKCRLNSIGK